MSSRAELSAQLAELFLFLSRKHPHLFGNLTHMHGEEFTNKLSAIRGKVDYIIASIGLVPPAPDKSAFLKIVYYQSHVTAASEQFPANPAL
jgi:hypothetical protein